MTTDNKKDLKDLAAKVKERQEFLVQVIDFVTWLLNGFGEVLDYHEFSSHTRQTREFKDVLNFDFWDHGANSMMGGWSLKVWYKKVLVLDLSWSDKNKPKLDHFGENPGWQRTLKRLCREDQATLFERVERLLDRRVKREQRQRDQKEKARLEQEQLLKDAARLGIKVE